MAAGGITKAKIEAAQRAVDTGREASITLRDGRVAGLSLVVGRRTQRWHLDFKLPLADGGWSGGKRAVLGDLATMDIEAARAAALAAKGQVALGVDPQVAKRARRAANIEAAGSQTVAAAIQRFTDERSPDWTRQTSKAFGRDFHIIREAIGDVPLGLVDRGRLVDLLAGSIAADGTGLSQATRVAGLLSALWRAAAQGTGRFAGWGWGVDPAVASRLPVAGRHRLTARQRVLSEAEIRDLWPALVAEGPLRPHRIVLALSLATGARVGAVALIEERDLDLDPLPIVGARDSGPTFTIRAAEGRKANAKARREAADLVLPLSGLAVQLFREALAIRRGAGPHVFEARLGPLVSGDVTRAWGVLRRAGRTPDGAVPHDLRRSMRTHIGELDVGQTHEDEERLIGHAIGSAVSRVYDRGRRLARLRPLACAWGERLEAIVGGSPAEVVALGRRP